jgi:hypothetical protein
VTSTPLAIGRILDLLDLRQIDNLAEGRSLVLKF